MRDPADVSRRERRTLLIGTVLIWVFFVLLVVYAVASKI